MKFSFSTLACPDYTWADIYSMAKDLGFDGIEVRGLGNDIFDASKNMPFSPRLLPATKQKLRALRPDEDIAAWAFRFLQSLPEVKVVLSGMSNLEQMEKNLATFSEDKPLHEEEMDALLAIAKDMVGKIALPCTACHYCVSHCPQGLDIPGLLALYNEHTFTGGGFIAPMAVEALPEEKRPAACIGCRSCEAVCPQQIKISEALADFAGMLKD